ncbi:uncharacterized protein LOC119072195 [Bradysia coprophila]|uniref:uncharacterized protein LOC119072195 n=1 Tax=Bradysia coprophila TaxID=38358 RepID=UPI00187DCD21|nr:uncharacterized protein LOC119072195 [Bradysia coprophila]
MSSPIPLLKDDNVIIGDGIHATEQVQSQNATSGQENSKVGGTKNDDTTISAHEPVKEVNKSDPSTSAAARATVSSVRQFDDEESEETMSTPSTSTVSIEAVESPEPKPTGSADVSTGRILLKRRRSRISMPAVSVAEEVDSAPPSAKKRSQKKQMVALFLESDYPRRK